MKSYSAVKVDVTILKAPLQSQAQGSGLWHRVLSRDIPLVPGTAAMFCPASGLPAFFPCLRSSPGMVHALVWQQGLSTYLELALCSLTQGRAAGVTMRRRAPNVPVLSGLTLLRASTLVFLPVLDVMAHVGATQARIDIFTERYF